MIETWCNLIWFRIETGRFIAAESEFQLYSDSIEWANVFSGGWSPLKNSILKLNVARISYGDNLSKSYLNPFLEFVEFLVKTVIFTFNIFLFSIDLIFDDLNFVFYTTNNDFLFIKEILLKFNKIKVKIGNFTCKN